MKSPGEERLDPGVPGRRALIEPIEARRLPTDCLEMAGIPRHFLLRCPLKRNRFLSNNFPVIFFFLIYIYI